MYTKSKIQLINEALLLKSEFESGLKNIMEKYQVEDSIFIYNKNVYEATKGYFVINEEYSDLHEAISNCNIFQQGIRIIDNSKYQVGYIFNSLSECPKDKQILDIDCLEYTN